MRWWCSVRYLLKLLIIDIIDKRKNLIYLTDSSEEINELSHWEHFAIDLFDDSDYLCRQITKPLVVIDVILSNLSNKELFIDLSFFFFRDGKADDSGSSLPEAQNQLQPDKTPSAGTEGTGFVEQSDNSKNFLDNGHEQNANGKLFIYDISTLKLVRICFVFDFFFFLFLNLWSLLDS